ncbi:diaminopimelate epimerase [Sedimentibacter hydroxybenzoicus DSM 7310]|uniref:Diaminopimelate epimerase n=1 Tax=Sedimentibacter hydroxybenzoicus DSM 7310 TaxID=1123245 RepID=A0A974BI56_SEDHY|nr:diaminopimelate epimerase [Sedimentibacter hydroxybenzoicus]NYB73247.1 diaminopimelate epimerase [Sedimentibacter hydroxybenzoicus DSM 7310]
MDFYKMQGAGNDFIIINNMKLNIPVYKLPSIAKKLCQRKLSIGADGFMVVDYPEGDADFKMRFFNRDGSEGEMCGNGARCISRYAYVNNLVGKKMTFETGAGIIHSEVIEGRLVKVLLNKPEVIKLDNDIEIDGIKYECSYIELGNPGLPHAVVKYDLQQADESKLREAGKKIRYYEGFPKGANVNFFEVMDKNSALVKTYERGVEDFTLACGTGSASTAVALMLKGYLTGDRAKIVVDGGELFVEVERTNNNVDNLYLIGTTNIVAIGEVKDEDLII